MTVALTSTTHRIPYTYTQHNKFESLSRCMSSIIKCNDNLISINGLVNHDICLLVKKCLLKDLNLRIFENYFILQKYNKSTRNNNYSIWLPWVKLDFAQQNFYFYGGKLYNKLPIGIRKLDINSELKVALKGPFLWYSYLIIIHAYMYLWALLFFFFFFLALVSFWTYIVLLHTIFATHFLFRSHYFHSAICVHIVFQAHGLLYCYTRLRMYPSCLISFVSCINFLNF